MTEEQIKVDREKRKKEFMDQLQDMLDKYEFALVAQDKWTPLTTVEVGISLIDRKKYDAAIAQPVNPKVVANITAAPARLPEGKQPDGSVVINPESLK